MKSILKLAWVLILATALAVLVFAQGTWSRRADAPVSGGHGEAVVGTCSYIYVVKQLYANTAPEFWVYDCAADKWQGASLTGLPLVPNDMPFRNGTALAWDGGGFIYALLGARYEDKDRRLFYRYNISVGEWQGPLAQTPHPQGAGDAITWSGYDYMVYALIGSNKHGGSVFARYDPRTDRWQELGLPEGWRCTDDGASLVWAGGEYLYALQGSDCGDKPSPKFARFHIPTGSWTELAPIPQGVDDGGSLLWTGNYVPEHADYIYALPGAVGEGPGRGFYRYSISKNQWEQLPDLPCPVGDYVGNRLGLCSGHIYYWQGSPREWLCGGNALSQFMEEGTPTDCSRLCQECLHRLNEVVTASDLEACPNIGAILAERIIQYRPYEPSECTVEGLKEELQKVPYVGEVRSDSVVKCICPEFYESCK